ncbi:hypothetical protein BDV96DRAFT_687135 [Lophiotrema nucula]|uniref:Secreted protein n=1 Tax=Lophiotrema nucula TaxID=690887 RepID=A0A6A5Z9P2_9PLEO|nr:hypothetical protein BDV96DRAFT_687135 [Lophiotrema nucula]
MPCAAGWVAAADFLLFHGTAAQSITAGTGTGTGTGTAALDGDAARSDVCLLTPIQSSQCMRDASANCLVADSDGQEFAGGGTTGHTPVLQRASFHRERRRIKAWRPNTHLRLGQTASLAQTRGGNNLHESYQVSGK